MAKDAPRFRTLLHGQPPLSLALRSSSIMMRSRRALFVFPTDQMGGAERITRMLVREAARSSEFKKIDCVILTGSRSGSLDTLCAKGIVSLHYFNARRAILGLCKLAKFLWRRPYLLVFSSHLHVNAFCSLLRKAGWLHAKHLVSRESTTVAERDFGRRGPFVRSLHRLYGAQDLIVCQTEFMRRALARTSSGRFADKLTVIPNPIDSDWIADSLRQPQPPPLQVVPETRKIIVWCGRLSPVKNPLLAVDTLAAIYDTGRNDVHLVMVGDGPLRGAVEARIAERGLQERVTLTGHLDAPPVAMKRAKVGLVTSCTEGFPNVVLEMLATGIPAIVTTPCTPALESVPGVEIQPARPLLLAEACLRLLEHTLPDPTVAEYLSARDSQSYFRAICSSAASGSLADPHSCRHK